MRSVFVWCLQTVGTFSEAAFCGRYRNKVSVAGHFPARMVKDHSDSVEMCIYKFLINRHEVGCVLGGFSFLSDFVMYNAAMPLLCLMYPIKVKTS